jgi:hypothetical protein
MDEWMVYRVTGDAIENNLPLITAGIIFSFVALMHILRVIYQWQIMIASYMIPMSVSIIAFIIAIILALCMFVSAAKN